MSKVQGDGYRTHTNTGLNDYYANVFRPAFLKMVDYKESRHHVGNFIIICEQSNEVYRDGYQLKSLRVIGREYVIRVRLDDEFDSKGNATGLSLSVDSFDNPEEANKKFLELKEMYKNP